MGLSICVQAETYDLLGKRGYFGKNYEKLINENAFQKDDILLLKDKKSYKILSFLGEGNFSKIYEVEGQKGEIFALRLPKVTEKINLFFSSMTINSLIDGYQILKNQGVNIAHIKEFDRDNYILHEKVDTIFSLKEFFTFRGTSWRNVNGEIERIFELENEEIYNRAKKSLVRFTKQIAKFKKIGDFHFDQVRYSLKEDRWILLDWNDSHILHEIGNKENPFTSKLIRDDFIQYEDYNVLLSIIKNQRRLNYIKSKCSLLPFFKKEISSY